MFSVFLASATSQITCKNVYGQNVDWFNAFKVPTLSDGISTHADGTGYFYHDPYTTLSEAEGHVNHTSMNPLYHTLKPLYEGRSDVGYALFSDQPPNVDDPSSSYAHLKGVILYDVEGGVYLVHSVPNYPSVPAAGQYAYPTTGTKYGQAFQCMTLSLSQLETFSQGLRVARPFTFDHYLPDFTSTMIPSLIQVVNDQYETAVTSVVKTITTIGGTVFKLLLKAREYGLDLYHELVAPTLGASTKSETWRLGSGTFDSDCSGSYESRNILGVQFGGVSWKTTKDHSKWAVAGSWVCVGDINRQNGQLKRGGGTYCRQDSSFAQLMENVITELEACP